MPVFDFEYSTETQGMVHNVEQNLKNLNIDVTTISGNKQSIKARFIDKKHRQQLIRVDRDQQSDPIQLLRTDGYDAIVISDYNKGSITYELIQKAVKSGLPVFVDTKKQDLQKIEGAIVKINEKEFKALDSTCSDLIVTLGESGTMWNEKIYPTATVDVADVCGAGDTFIAALVVSYLKTQNIENSIKFANRAASVTVQHIGVYAPTEDEIL